jgi:hypothetical protein
MAAVERAADVQVQKRTGAAPSASGEPAQVMTTHVVKGVRVEDVFCNVHRGVGDVSLGYNGLEPRLGDRIINLTCPGVPFGLRGTVVTIHSSTKFVEVRKPEIFVVYVCVMCMKELI